MSNAKSANKFGQFRFLIVTTIHRIQQRPGCPSDLRRTCRTIMAREGVLPHVAEQVLGHAQVGIESIYDQHTYLKEKLVALEKVENAICKILGISGERDKVIELRRVG